MAKSHIKICHILPHIDTMEDKIKIGRIYKIYSLVNPNDFYIGSTQDELRCRWWKHKSTSKRPDSQNRLWYKLMQEIGYKNMKIIELEKIECTKAELLQLEGKYMLELKPNLNKYNAGNGVGKTRKEYNKEYHEINKEKYKLQKKKYAEEHKESIKEYKKYYYEENKLKISEEKKAYREKNKDIIHAKKNEKHMCECGIEYTNANHGRHVKTLRHKKFVDDN